MPDLVKNILRADFAYPAEAEAFARAVKVGDKDFSFESFDPMPKTLSIPCPASLFLVYAAVQHYGLDLNKYPENVREGIAKYVFPFKNEFTNENLAEKYTRAKAYRVSLPDAITDEGHDEKDVFVSKYDLFREGTKADFDAISESALTNIKKYGVPTWYEWQVQHWGCKWDAWDAETEVIGKSVKITFITANSTPIKAIETLSKFHPFTDFDVEYADEDIGTNCGWYKCNRGFCLEHDLLTNYEDMIEFACGIWGLDPKEYRKRMAEDE